MNNYYNYLDEAFSLFDKAIKKEQNERADKSIGEKAIERELRKRKMRNMTEEQLIEAVKSGDLQVDETKEVEVL